MATKDQTNHRGSSSGAGSAGPLSRRQMLARCGSGMGLIGLAAVSSNQRAAAGDVSSLGQNEPSNPLAPRPSPFKPRARRIIHLYMNGGPSHVDTFDPKPALEKYKGQRPDSTAQLKTENGTGGLLPSPFKFPRCGKSGLPISEIFPNVARHADDLCVIRSMYTDVPNHEPSMFMMNTGHIQPVRPSYGSWLLYGLGTENQNLPGYVVLGEGLPVNGPANWSSRFLPGIYQGSHVDLPRQFDPRNAVPYLRNGRLSNESQRRQLDLIQKMNQLQEQRQGGDHLLDARVASFELAFRMQTSAQEAFDLGAEPDAILERYGLTRGGGGSVFAMNCLLARRLAERDVRVVQVYFGNWQPWDTHSENAKSHRSLAQTADQPVAALLDDLKERGLLDDTLVLCGGEFGRTPASQGSNGRDHNHYGFSVWLAGGGVKGGIAHGATDEFGFTAAQDKVHVHDLHATMLHLMGIDHKGLTYRYAGRDFRLTDVYGNVVHDIIA